MLFIFRDKPTVVGFVSKPEDSFILLLFNQSKSLEGEARMAITLINFF